MHYVFLINPHAGKGAFAPQLIARIETLFSSECGQKDAPVSAKCKPAVAGSAISLPAGDDPVFRRPDDSVPVAGDLDVPDIPAAVGTGVWDLVSPLPPTSRTDAARAPQDANVTGHIGPGCAGTLSETEGHASSGAVGNDAVQDARSLSSYEIYQSTAAGDILRFAGAYALPAVGQTCFVACGGDGTLNETVNGLMQNPACLSADGSAALSPRVLLAVYPCGSGNDFIRAFPGEQAFFDLSYLKNALPHAIDLLACSGRIAVNECNMGFDADVAKNMIKFKKHPLIGGELAYFLSVFYCLIHKLCRRMRVVFDDGTVLEEDYLLAVAANGLCYGGGFHPAPLAKIDDGIIDFCGFTRVSRFFISRLVGQYKAGKHLEHPALKAHVNYKRCTSFTVESDVPFTICMDGEISSGYRLDVHILPRALQILLPASCVPEGKRAAHQVKDPAAARI